MPRHMARTNPRNGSTIRNVVEDGACEGDLVDSCEAGMGWGSGYGVGVKKEMERGWSRCE